MICFEKGFYQDLTVVYFIISLCKNIELYIYKFLESKSLQILCAYNTIAVNVIFAISMHFSIISSFLSNILNNFYD